MARQFPTERTVNMDDAVFKDFFSFGLHPGVPLKTAYFLAHICYRHGGTRGARLSDPTNLARILEIKADDLTAIVARTYAVERRGRERVE